MQFCYLMTSLFKGHNETSLHQTIFPPIKEHIGLIKVIGKGPHDKKILPNFWDRL